MSFRRYLRFSGIGMFCVSSAVDSLSIHVLAAQAAPREGSGLEAVPRGHVNRRSLYDSAQRAPARGAAVVLATPVSSTGLAAAMRRNARGTLAPQRRRHVADAKTVGGVFSRVSRRQRHNVGLVQRTARLPNTRGAGKGQRHALRSATQSLTLSSRSSFRTCSLKVPLRDVHALGSPTEVQLLGNHHEIPQMPRLLRAPPPVATSLTGRT
jgi:hypothetical protein